MKKKLITILTICFMLFASLGVIGCGETGGTGNGGNATNAQIMAIYNSYLLNAQEEGVSPLSYEDWLATIKGEKGDKGDQGEQGIQGEKGDKGDQGEQGIQGEKGDKGDQGEAGKDGSDGKSAYEIWLEVGNVGTEEDFLEWLKMDQAIQGVKGDKGDQGEPGKDGNDGKSAYQIWLDNGHTGSQADFLNWLKGEKGDKGDQGEQGIQGEKGDKGDQGEQGIQGEKGDKGDQGEQGIQGEKGDKGDQGVGIADMYITEDGYLMVKYTNSNEYVNLGKVIPTVHEHTFGNWLVYSDSSESCEEKFFYRECSSCDEVVFKKGSYSDHSFETSYKFDKNYHYINCKNCKVQKNYAEHTAGNDGFCMVCGAPVVGTVGLLYDISSDGTYYEVIGYEGSSTKILIPDTYEGKPVKTIYKNAFYNNDNITSVIISDSVTSIGDQAFYSCNKLTSIEIPEGVTSIGENAFYYCRSLASVTFGENSQLTSIGNGAFNNCSSLTSIEIPESVTSIGRYAFSNCSSLEFTIEGNCKYLGNKDNKYLCLIEVTSQNYSSYTINNNCKVIAGEVFYNCPRLTSIEIPDSVTSIGYRAFDDCSSLTSVTFGENSQLTNIGDNAFEYCSSLTSVTFGENSQLTSIGDYAFYDCSSLTSIEIPESVTSIGENAFYNCSSLTSINYSGTKAQWNAISKGSSWDAYVDATVYCSDGTISI